MNKTENLRILSNHEIVLGNLVLSYNYKDSLLFDLQANLSSCLTSDTVQENLMPLPNAKIRQVTPSDAHQAKTVLDAFREAEDYFFRIETPFAGTPFKIVREEEPLFLMEVYGLQDAVEFAIADYGDSHSMDDLFAFFMGDLGYWWIADYVGVPVAIQLAEEFFHRYYPIVKKKLTAGEK